MAVSRPTPSSYYYSGQGRLGVGIRDTVSGRFDELLFIGNVTSLTLDIATTKFEHKEQMTGQRAVDLTIVQEKNATFKFTSESLVLDLLSVGVYGQSAVVASGSVTGETHKVKKGYAIPLKHPKVGSVVVNKSGSPVTEAGNWDYDADFGTIHVLPTASGLTDGDTVTVNYTYAGYSRLEAFTQSTSPERYLRFEGLNTVDGSFRIIEIPRGQFDPLTGLEMINEELGSGEFNGTILPDLTITGNGLSQYFRELRF